MTAIEIVKNSRDKARPTALTYIGHLCDDFVELHGDRKFSDDKAIVGGIATINGMPITVIGIEKGGDTTAKIMRNFGSSSPEGYRKALRLIVNAQKFHRGVLTIVDTSGAACGIGAEERGQAEAIATSIRDLFDIQVPILSLLVGEGGSGGALALAVADEVWVTGGSTYSVISPEGCASILWKDSTRVAEAADALKMTAPELYAQKVVERILQENGFCDEFYSQLKTDVFDFFVAKNKLTTTALLKARYDRFRAF